MSNSFQSRVAGWYLKVQGNLRFLFKPNGVLEYLTPPVVPASGGEVPCASQLPFTKEYVSPEQTIASAALYNLEHGLGKVPSRTGFEYVCTAASEGYVAGEVIEVPGSNYGGSAGTLLGVFITKSDTHLYVRIGSSGATILCNKTTGGVVSSTTLNANFKIRLRAWA